MEFPQRSILVTGAHGPLPTAFLNWLDDTPHQVFRVTRNPQPGEFSWTDLLEGNLLKSATDVIDFAWSTVTSTSERNPGIEWKIDLPRLYQLVTRIIELGNSAPRFIFVSSGGTVYGNAREHPSQENDPLFPCNWHGFAKAAAESLICRFGHLGLDFTIVRPSNVYGFPPHSGPRRFLSHLLNTISEKKTFEVWGDGTALKDYLYVEDFVAGMGEIVQRKLSGVFNIAAGRSYSVSEVIQIAEEVVGEKIRVIYRDAPEWDVTRNLLSREKICEHTSWQPTVSLPQGLHSLWEMYREAAVQECST